MKKRYLTPFLFVFLLFSINSPAQSFKGNLKIENITFPEGDQLAYIYDIAQDSTGLIWFFSNTTCKVYTYDGNNLKTVENEVLGFSLDNCYGFYSNETNPFFYISQDSLIVFNPITKKLIGQIAPGKIKNTSPPSNGTHTTENLSRSYEVRLSGDTIWAIAVKKAPGPAKLLYVLRAKNNEAFQIIDSLDLNRYYDKALIRNGRYFIKQRDRVEEFGPSGRVHIYYFPEGPDPVMPSMVKDSENTLWVVHSPNQSADQFGVYYLKEGQKEFARLPEDQRFPQEKMMGKLFADGAYIWHRGYPFRLSRMRIADGKIEDFTDKIIEQKFNFPFYNSSLLNIFRDRSGELWFTTRAGVVKLSIEEDIFRKFHLNNTIISDCSEEKCDIRGMVEDENGNLYLSHFDGISKLNPKTGQLTPLRLDLPPQLQKTHALSYTDHTLFWNEYAIDLRSGRSHKIVPSSDFDYLTHCMNPEHTRLWIAVNHFPFEFYEYNLKTKTLRELRLDKKALPNSNLEVRQMVYNASTNTLFLAIWMKGVLELDLEGNIRNEYHTYKNPGLWPSNYMYKMYLDGEDQLWAAHGGESGLSKIDLRTREVTIWPYQSKPANDHLKRVFRILAGKEDLLWLVTEKGTMSLDKKTGVLTSFPMFPTMTNMAYDDLPAYAAKNGTLFIGTLDGSLYAFDPENLYKKAKYSQPFPVVISRYERYNQKQDTLYTNRKNLINLSEIHLTHQDRYFSLEFYVPDYRNANQNLYTYWLEDYEEEWSAPSKINQLRYENLPPGTYTLHIRGGLTPKYYKSSERVVKIIVFQAWYKRWWAWCLYAVTFLSLVYLIYRYQVGRHLEKAEASRIKELDLLKSRLYTNITHEFRTPLTVIMGMANNIQGHAQEKALIARNGKNLLLLINQLLDLSKLDSGTLSMQEIQGDIINYLQYLTESFYSMAREKQIRLTFYPEVRSLIMDYDETKIQHVVYNLLSNAIKFTPEGGKVILHARTLEKPGSTWLQLKVSDTGMGISEEHLPKIFDRFYQGDASSTRREAGTGIGLALTQELVDLMGGKIVVESKLGVGTDFLILLPIKNEAKAVKQDENTKHLDPAMGDESEFKQSSENFVPSLAVNTFIKDSETPSILIIEDNRDVVTYIGSLLNKHYLITVAQNGQEGIDIALEIIPDIIISDVMMPEKDGYEVCKTLKLDDRTSHIPIILLTAKAAPQDRIEGLKGGADAFLTKPFNPQELFVRLEKLIDLRKVLQQRYAQAGYILSPVKSGTNKPTLDDLFLEKLVKVVQDRLNDSDLEVLDLCKAVHLSNMQVNRKLKALTGKTPSRFIRSIRLQKAKELLETSQLNVSEIAYQVGFSEPNYFSRCFSEEFGIAPNVIRK